AIRSALTAKNADQEAFLLGDRETVTWADFYRRIAMGLGVPFEEVHQMAMPVFHKRWTDEVNRFRSFAAMQAILPFIPPRLKRIANAALSAWPEPALASQWALPETPTPAVTQEMAELQRCCYKLPTKKAEQLLGYRPIVSFEEGCRRSVEWLGFAGYKLARDLTGNVTPA